MKIKKEKIYDKILKKIEEIDSLILYDIAADLINDAKIGMFNEYIDFQSSINKDAYPTVSFIPLIVKIILSRANNWVKLLDILIKLNNTYLNATHYPSYSEEELIKEFEKDVVPSIVGFGVAPEMLILYYFSKQNFTNKKIPFLIEQWKRNNERINAKQLENTSELTIPDSLKNSMFEYELKQFISEDEVKNFPDDESIEEIVEQNGFIYNKEDKTITVPRGFVLFFLNKMETIATSQQYLDNLQSILSKYSYYIDHKTKFVLEVLSESKEKETELKKTKIKLANARKKIKELENIIDRDRQNDNENILNNEIKRLRKQLLVSQTRIEDLEQKIAEIEEEKKINLEINDNVEIEIEHKESEKLIIPDFSFIVVSGGKWNSRTKGEVEEFFDKYQCLVKFISAEDTLKKQDLIANADIVIFDTSRHAHKYYLKIKSINKNILHISKSSLDNILENFKVKEV